MPLRKLLGAILLLSACQFGQRDQDLVRKLDAARRARGPAYQPRTRHLHPDGSPKYTNRLILESSPYLLQHAHNPVDWRPWGDEAFELARKLGRPVLLSVGYSTCHWCHVMEEESFEDEEIARYLNDNYVAVKVDREERPDVDAIYMTAVQALAGRGGWPMTVWLTPDRKPFYAGTYFPPRDGDRGVSTGFLTLLKKLREIYDTEPQRITESSAHITEKIQEFLGPKPGGGPPQERLLGDAVRYSREHFDAVNGGARGAPKFPSGLPTRLLLRYHRRSGDPEPLHMAALTLEKMAAGGMYDQVGGGFHRYSTDEKWLVPHFEKMLYDNALLVMDYLEAYQATGRQDFARVARDILRYLERDMTSPEGAFYSATDADSPGPDGKREEGWFFTWTAGEIEAVLGKQSGVGRYYGAADSRSILRIAGAAPPEDLATAREALYRARLRRPPPLGDQKILTSWNGLAISAHARASLALRDDRYAQRAARTATFLLDKLRRDGRLLRSYMDGQARHNAYLDDYAFLTAGLLDLYEATGGLRWIEEAIRLDSVLEKHYEDPAGGFFLTSNDHERLLAREKPFRDGAEPSGNSVALMNLLRLHEFTTQDRYRQRGERALRAFSPQLVGSPGATAEMLLALDFHLDTPKEILIVTPAARWEAGPLLQRLGTTHLPNRILAVVSQGPELAAHARVVPLLKAKTALKGKATAYVCEKRTCELPTSDPEVFARQLRKVAGLER